MSGSESPLLLQRSEGAKRQDAVVSKGDPYSTYFHFRYDNPMYFGGVEMSDAELAEAVSHSGAFKFWDDPSESIYDEDK